MNSEQMLKEVKERRRQWRTTRTSDFNWLIEQVERVEDLLKMNGYLRKQREENKRLREALKFYADEKNWHYELNSDVVQDCGDKARQALERELK